MEVCRWIVREGNGFPYWAFTTCKKGFNPLTKVSKVSEIRPQYENRLCPICGKNIELNMEIVEDED